jgi:hypothetical protein
MKEATWLSLIIIMPKKNGMFRIQKIEFSNKDLFPLPIIDEVLNTVARCEAYSFLDGILDTIKYLHSSRR